MIIAYFSYLFLLLVAILVFWLAETIYSFFWPRHYQGLHPFSFHGKIAPVFMLWYAVLWTVFTPSNLTVGVIISLTLSALVANLLTFSCCVKFFHPSFPLSWPNCARFRVVVCSSWNCVYAIQPHSQLGQLFHTPSQLWLRICTHFHFFLRFSPWALRENDEKVIFDNCQHFTLFRPLFWENKIGIEQVSRLRYLALCNSQRRADLGMLVVLPTIIESVTHIVHILTNKIFSSFFYTSLTRNIRGIFHSFWTCKHMGICCSKYVQYLYDN